MKRHWEIFKGRLHVTVTIDWRFFAAVAVALLLLSPFVVVPSLLRSVDTARKENARLRYENDCRSRANNALSQVQGQFFLQVGRGLVYATRQDRKRLDKATTQIVKLTDGYERSLRARNRSDTLCHLEADRRYP
jgi:type II secretory pathway pseudopilin PulG